MKDSSQLQSRNSTDALMEELDKTCNTCGDTCHHDLSTPDRTGEICMPNVVVQEDERRGKARLDESIINVEALVEWAKKPRSLRPRKRRTIGVSSTLTKTQVVLSKDPQVNTERGIKRTVVLALRAPGPNNISLVHTPKTVKERAINHIVCSEENFGSQAKEPESKKAKSKAGEDVTTKNKSSSGVVVYKEVNIPCRVHNRSQKCGSQQDENPAEASKSMMKGPPFDERFQETTFETQNRLKSVVIPVLHCAWRGKFQIHNNEGITRDCYWLQAHASNQASSKVLEMAVKLPKTIILDELPRSEIWPSIFMGSEVTEEDIGLYFYPGDMDSYNTYYDGLINHMTKNDLALRGNIDGVELLIFSSNLLPEGTQQWNSMLYFWSVFIKERKVKNSADIPASSSSKPIREFDLNAYPEDEDGAEGAPDFDSRDGTRASEDEKGKSAMDLSTFAPSSSAVNAMDTIGCETAKGSE